MDAEFIAHVVAADRAQLIIIWELLLAEAARIGVEVPARSLPVET